MVRRLEVMEARDVSMYDKVVAENNAEYAEEANGIVTEVGDNVIEGKIAAMEVRDKEAVSKADEKRSKGDVL
ncbi:hypothetical protein Ancab_019329 [Ancistrocladus abbreviatus]